MKVKHNINPIFNENSKILILGSMPSIKSRESNFFYAHKTNRFWPIINIIFNVNLTNNNEKKEFLLKNNIAMWDTIKSCDIEGSSDASIKNVEINPIKDLIKKTKIETIFCTGKTSYNLLTKNLKIDIPIICLPSPSSANAKLKLEDLTKEYKIIKDKLK